MILSLRKQHHRAFIGLAVALPVVFAVGISMRETAPVVAGLPAALGPAAQSYKSVGQPHLNLFTNTSLQVRFLSDPKESGLVAIQFIGSGNIVRPDLLAYWVAGNPAVAGTVPDNAILLGAFGSGALALPDKAARSEGILVLYSLADGEIVDVSKPFSLSTANVSTH